MLAMTLFMLYVVEENIVEFVAADYLIFWDLLFQIDYFLEKTRNLLGDIRGMN